MGRGERWLERVIEDGEDGDRDGEGGGVRERRGEIGIE